MLSIRTIKIKPNFYAASYFWVFQIEYKWILVNHNIYRHTALCLQKLRYRQFMTLKIEPNIKQDNNHK